MRSQLKQYLKLAYKLPMKLKNAATESLNVLSEIEITQILCVNKNYKQVKAMLQLPLMTFINF